MANIELSRYLYAEKLISTENYNDLIYLFATIRDGWIIIKNKIIKSNVTLPINYNFKERTDSAKKLLKKEIEVWELIVYFSSL